MPPTELERIVDRHGWQLMEFERSVERTDATVENIRRDLKTVVQDQQQDHEAFTRYIAVAENAATAAREAADKGVTTKQLYLSFILAVCAVIGTLIGIHA